jgi:hypothetical protein
VIVNVKVAMHGVGRFQAHGHEQHHVGHRLVAGTTREDELAAGRKQFGMLQVST